jgi:hypothetical protein
LGLIELSREDIVADCLLAHDTIPEKKVEGHDIWEMFSGHMRVLQNVG